MTWFTVCATWDVAIWVADPDTGARVACPSARVVLPLHKWVPSSGSSSGSSSGPSSGSSSGPVAEPWLGLGVSMAFDTPVVNTEAEEGAAENMDVVESVYVTGLQQAVMRNLSLDVVLTEMGLWDLFKEVSDKSGLSSTLAVEADANLRALQGQQALLANESRAFIGSMQNRTQDLRKLSANVAVTAIMYGTVVREIQTRQNVSEAAMDQADAALQALVGAVQGVTFASETNATRVNDTAKALKREIDAMYADTKAQYEAQAANATKTRKAILAAHSKPHKNKVFVLTHVFELVALFLIVYVVTLVYDATQHRRKGFHTLQQQPEPWA